VPTIFRLRRREKYPTGLETCPAQPAFQRKGILQPWVKPLKISVLERTTRKAVTTAGYTGEAGTTLTACYLP
jgi:hypothetical protein